MEATWTNIWDVLDILQNNLTDTVQNFAVVSRYRQKQECHCAETYQFTELCVINKYKKQVFLIRILLTTW